jgi:hypothetical protein
MGAICIAENVREGEYLALDNDLPHSQYATEINYPIELPYDSQAISSLHNDQRTTNITQPLPNPPGTAPENASHSSPTS